MHIVHTVTELRQSLQGCSQVVLVPTMGNLHAGHLSLVRHARQLGQTVVVSIFVNRLQFAPHEDFDRYPRTLAQDCALLREVGCDVVFAPQESHLYPQPQRSQRYTVSPPAALADILEGEFRPGFFVGVCTVVLKLFSCVQPHYAVFGKKDYQQWRVIGEMVQQFNLPIEVVGVDTVRGEDGLALSSRNGYLSEVERHRATDLARVLGQVRAGVLAAQLTHAELEMAAMAQLQGLGWQPDYVAVRRQCDLQMPGLTSGLPEPLVVVAAARLGATRLIDNLEI